MSDEKKPISSVELKDLKEKQPLEVAVIQDPTQFEVGLATQLGNIPLIAFIKDGKPTHALAFKGEAGEKLLLSMLAVVDLLHGIGEDEAAKFVIPEIKDKKKPTLH